MLARRVSWALIGNLMRLGASDGGMIRSLLSLGVLACSLVLCLLMLVLWVRSYWVVDCVSWCTSSADKQICSGGGRVVYADAHWPNGRVTVPMRYDHFSRQVPMWFEHPAHSDGYRRMGFEYSEEIFPYPNDQTVWFYIPPWRMAAIPYAAPFALSLIYPLVRLAGVFRRRSRRRRGLCAACGYDLRASSGRCPECGVERV